MARKTRIEFPGALFHVFARGNHKNKIFLTLKDYQKYLDLIKQYKKCCGFKLYAYALMPNHVHLLIETTEIPLSKIMQGLQQSYTQFFNLKYSKVGHLFQGRYKAIICQKDTYLLELVRYIHLNPIRAGVTKNLSDYPWTSNSYYTRNIKTTLIDTDFVLQLFASNRTAARMSYKQFIKEGMDNKYNQFCEESIDQRILGNKKFVEEILETKNEIKVDAIEKPNLEKILDVICSKANVLPQTAKSNVKIKEIVWIRQIFCYITRVSFGYRLGEIALFLGIDVSTISKNVRRTTDRLRKDGRLSREIRNIRKECLEYQA